MKEKVTISTIIRTVLLTLALVNQVLTTLGISLLPIEDEQATEIISISFTAVTSLITWWKNNSFTTAAIECDKIMKTKKEN